MFCRIGIKISSHCLARVDHASSLRFWANLGATFGEFKAEVPEDGHAEPPKAQSPRKRSFWLELSGSAVLETRSVFFWWFQNISNVSTFFNLSGLEVFHVTVLRIKHNQGWGTSRWATPGKVLDTFISAEWAFWFCSNTLPHFVGRRWSIFLTYICDCRRVDATDGKIVVGRAWQFDLHKKACHDMPRPIREQRASHWKSSSGAFSVMSEKDQALDVDQKIKRTSCDMTWPSCWPTVLWNLQRPARLFGKRSRPSWAESTSASRIWMQQCKVRCSLPTLPIPSKYI